MDIEAWVLVGLTSVVIPSGSYLISKIVNLDTRITTHEDVDKVRFDNIDKNLNEVKGHVKIVNDKLDRLIERFL